MIFRLIIKQTFFLWISLLFIQCQKNQGTATTAPSKAPTYVKSSTCVECHAEQYSQWMGSHHQKAMDEATAKTVLGDFNNQTFIKDGVKTVFTTHNKEYWVHTKGADGKYADFKVKYTFGVYPLQQYLIAFPNGAVQCLTVAWDSQKNQWFSLDTEDNIPPGDWLHWTGQAQNWNGMCADCHSTNLVKNYDGEKKSYQTTFSEINVACEACHGPGSNHVAWAKQAGSTGSPAKNQVRDSSFTHYGLLKNISDYSEIESCAHCHSRRSQLVNDPDPEESFHDKFDLMLLDDNLYYPDGQILDEVYVLGSFMQSKMYRKGVRCIDCHDPHTATLKAKGNALCTSCHQHPANIYDTTAHHHHPAGSEGAQCINCHMPGKIYMENDYRRDHSFRIPRPDLSEQMGSPNGCIECHDKKTNAWAASAIEKWTGKPPKPHYSQVMHRTFAGHGDTGPLLIKIIRDTSLAEIVRATALKYLRSHTPEPFEPLSFEFLEHKNPLLRKVALQNLQGSPRLAANTLLPSLKDSLRSIRLAAFNTLTSVPRQKWNPELVKAYGEVRPEYLEMMETNGDFSSGQMNLGIFYTQTGRPDKAVKAYERALEIDSLFNFALVNLANLYHQMGDKLKAIQSFERLIRQEPNYPGAYYSLALVLAETQNYQKALPHFEKAAKLDTNNVRILYNLGLTYQNLNRRKDAEKAFLKALPRAPGSEDFWNAITILYIQWGKKAQAQKFAQEYFLQFRESEQAKSLLTHAMRMP